MKKALSSFLVLILSLVSLTGCSKDTEKYKNNDWGVDPNTPFCASLVVGKHANGPNLNFNSDKIQDLLFLNAYCEGSISVIEVDGNPFICMDEKIPEYLDGISENKKRTLANGYAKEVTNVLYNAQANEPEADPMKAITLSASVLQGKSTGKKIMLIMDSGLGTTGYMDFSSNPLLEANETQIVDALKKENALPNLEGIEVYWLYCGQVSSPQNELSESEKKHLQSIWSSILTESGAVKVTFASDIASGDEYKELPSVTTIDPKDRSIDVILDTFVLDESKVGFIGDKSEFVNEKVALKKLEEVATVLKDHPHNTVYVVGTTATGNKEFCDTLSLDRANKVVNTLIQLGVSKTQLIPKGLGFNNNFHKNDIENGVLIESLAKENRRVLIIDVKSEDAKKIS